MSEKNIVVLGAGVAGLTTALLLAKNPRYRITVAAKHMPGDYDIEYASPWAGANYVPFSKKGSRAQEWERATWESLVTLAKDSPDAGIHFQKCRIYTRKKHDSLSSTTGSLFSELFGPNPWFRTLFDDFQEIPKSELGPGINRGMTFTSVCINTAIYLPWLVSQCLKNGVVFKRAIFTHITDAAAVGVHHSGKSADLVVNCTGLSASTLGGVEDKSVIPIRGQIVIVRNVAPNMITVVDDGSEESCYMMTRAAGGGTILGGCYQKGNRESQPDPSLANRIMSRCVAACPELAGGKGIEGLDVIRHGVGLRPVREGGSRIERERIDNIAIVHNYGAGIAGYQSSYGCAGDAARLVDETFQEKAKL